jgi:hypothetical protein
MWFLNKPSAKRFGAQTSARANISAVLFGDFAALRELLRNVEFGAKTQSKAAKKTMYGGR